MKYIKVEWPEIQDYLLYGQNNIVDYDSYYYFDPIKNCWFVPEDWELCDSGLRGNVGDLKDAMG